MSTNKRSPGSREDDAWLSDEQLEQCRPAESEPFRSPVPTRMVSNGEYMPHPQTEKQKRVEARTKELAEGAAKKLGMSRRQFLASTGGLAASFLAMNEVFGRFFDVRPVEMFEPQAFTERGAPRNLFILDDQLHTIRSTQMRPRSLRAVAQGPGPASTAAGFLSNPFNSAGLPDELGDPWTPWNPALGQMPNTGEAFQLVQFIKDVYLDSQVTVGVLSNANIGFIQNPDDPAPRPPRNVEESLGAESLTGLQTAAVRDFVNQIAGSTRLLAHGQIYPGIANLEFMQWQIDTFHPDSWKGYNIAHAAKVDFDPTSDMRMWRLDDEFVAYPMFDLIAQNRRELKKHPGFFNICIHKGLAPGLPESAERGHPRDLPKAATDWPEFNFIIYHSCIQPAFFVLQSLEEIQSGATRLGVPDIKWVTEFCELAAPFPNVYAEIGTTFASSVVTFPTVCAHILGQLLKFFGPDRVLFGSDSVWYGGPQWQIEAFWRFEIPEDMRLQYGYPELTKGIKRKILGLNSARLYRLPSASEAAPRGVYKPVPEDYEARISDELKTIMEFPGFTADNIETLRRAYAALGGQRDNARHGWIRRTG